MSRLHNRFNKKQLRKILIDCSKKKYNFFKKNLAIRNEIVYTITCCDMIAMKREVAA